MKFCHNCGKEVLDEAKFCVDCGATLQKTENIEVEKTQAQESTVVEEREAVQENIIAEEQVVVEESVPYNTELQEIYVQPVAPTTYTVVKTKKSFKEFFTKKVLIIIAVILVVAGATGAVIANISSKKAYEDSMNAYEEKLTSVYQTMSEGAGKAEEFCSLESKVWRNCIYENNSSETDRYTKNGYGWFYSDFNDALRSFYAGEQLLYSLIEANVETVDTLMSELKDYPEEFEEEYKAVKEMYVVYADLTDLAVGDSTYSLTTFEDTLERLKADFKSAESAAKLLVG